MGSGLDGIHRGFGSAFGIALGSMLVERRLMAHEMALGEEHELLASQTAAYQDTFLVLCGITLLALLPALLVRAPRVSVADTQREHGNQRSA
jgi:fucose permease